MTRRSPRGGDAGGNNDLGRLPIDDVEDEAAATTTAIVGLRRRLMRPGSLDHPSVRRELRKLADELAELEDGKRRPGRHRSNVTRLPVRPAAQPAEPVRPAAKPVRPADQPVRPAARAGQPVRPAARAVRSAAQPTQPADDGPEADADPQLLSAPVLALS
jgi:hypothetical protein